MNIIGIQEFLKSGSHKGLHIFLHEIKYKDRCNIPNKLPIFEFCKKNKIPYAKLLQAGHINEINFNLLPENFCLKPIDGCTSRGVFLMHKKKNLRTGKIYKDLNDIRADYIEESKQNIGYSHDCYVETLHQVDGEIPEDISVFMIRDKVGCILQARRIGQNKVKVFYDEKWGVIESTGSIEKPNASNKIIAESKKIMKVLGVPFMRIDFYAYGDKYFLGELTPVSGISGTLSASFLEMKTGRKIDEYLGYLFERSFNNPFEKFDRIVVISLKECSDRLERFRKMADEYGIKFDVFDAIKHEVGSYGCSLSHLEIIKKAEKDKLKNVLVFEDDAIFMYPKLYIWEQVEKYFKTKCDVFYLGCICAWAGESEIINGNEIEYKSVLGRHSLVYNKSFFKYWIDKHPSIEEFMQKREVRGDVLLAHSQVVKKGCFPITTVNTLYSYTGTNAMKLEKPLNSGEDHQRLIISAYASKGLLDYPMLKKEIKDNLFVKSKYLENRIRELFLQSNPFLFIEDVRYINLVKDEDRREQTEKMFNKYRIKASRFNAILNPNGWAGSTLSHRGCILWAKMMDRENVLIFEDDAVFIEEPERFKKMLMQAIYDAGDYDILYLGLSLTTKADNIRENLYRVGRGWGAYAYLVNKRVFKKLLSLLPSDPKLISQENRTVSDVIYYDKIMPDGRCVLTPLCSSRDNFSNNWKRDSNDVYNKIIQLYSKYLITHKTFMNSQIKNSIIPRYDNKNQMKHDNSSNNSSINVYVINRDADIDRWVKIKSYVESPIRISAIPLNDPQILELSKNIKKSGVSEETILKEISNRLSFCKALQKAKDNGDERCIILEDDCVFIEDLRILKEDIDKLPADFGLFYLGYYIKQLSSGFFVPFTDKILEASGSFYIWGAHAIVYNKIVFDYIIDELSKYNAPITDLFISMKVIPKFRSFFRYPMAVNQNFDTRGSMHNGLLDFRGYNKYNDVYISKHTVCSSTKDD